MTITASEMSKMRVKFEKPCKHCKNLFVGLKKQRFCSDKCRYAAAYQKRKNEKPHTA